MTTTTTPALATWKRPLHQTEWAAAFATAAELSQRGYDVAFTMGNTPTVDLLCQAPGGPPFKVQVKGISYANGLRVQLSFFTDPPQDDLYLVIVFVPLKEDEPRQFFILTHKQAQEAYESMTTARLEKAGAPYRGSDTSGGFNWGTIQPYKDKWKSFPAIPTRAPSPNTI